MSNKVHQVVFWEEVDTGNMVPCCEASVMSEMLDENSMQYCTGQNNKLKSGTMVQKAKLYHYIKLQRYSNDTERNYKDFRKQLKTLYSCGYKNFWNVVNTTVHTSKTYLENLLYYQIELTYSPRKYYFQRLHTVDELSSICYVSDDSGVVILKFDAGRLRCIYLDVVHQKTYFHNIRVSNSTTCGVRFCNGSLWIIQTPVRRYTEIILVSFTGTSVNSCKAYLQVNEQTFSNFLSHVTVSKYYLMLLKHQQYLYYNESEKALLVKSVPQDIAEDATEIRVIHNTCLIVGKIHDRKCPPVLYVVMLKPEMKIFKKIDLSVSLHNYEQYIPYGFEVTVYERSMKALIRTGESYIIVIDLKKGVVSQILSYIDCFWQHKLSIYFSLDGETVIMLGKLEQLTKPDITEYLYASFYVWHGFSLKDLSKKAVLDSHSLKEIKNLNIPRYLRLELEYFK